ncbi:MAG: imidazoleglycerol-phosphate dehydratase HisB [Candidatus Omnitrophica bacterium]|nr:imidazoleglycerol-phosphate dehydratase HisB [Candidatus Omnitrophota bacterium]
MQRKADIKRKTKETEISVKLNLDGKGRAEVSTGIGFLDHMLELFAFHGLFDLDVQARGDLKVDIHHTNEDIGICLGQVFKKALGECVGIKRFGSAEVPMDQARAKVAIDISNRYAFRRLEASGRIEPKEKYSLDDANDLLDSFAKNMNINLHADVISGTDLHHVLEAVFKAFGIALDQATQIDPRRKEVPSTKGIL